MKPIGRRTEYTAWHPVQTHDLIGHAVFIGLGAEVARPHQRIPRGAQNDQRDAAATTMGLAISTHRPFNQLADQTVLGNLEANDFDPATSANFSIPTKFAHIRNKIGLVNPLTTILSQVIAIARREIIRRATVTVVEN